MATPTPARWLLGGTRLETAKTCLQVSGVVPLLFHTHSIEAFTQVQVSLPIPIGPSRVQDANTDFDSIDVTTCWHFFYLLNQL